MKSRYIVAAVVLLVVAVGLVIVFNSTNKASTFEISGGNLSIGGAFAVDIPLSDIGGLKLTDTMPEIDKMLGGSGLKGVYKGEFSFKDGTQGRVYADTSIQSFITFAGNEGVYYINTESVDETQKLYDELAKAIG